MRVIGKLIREMGMGVSIMELGLGSIKVLGRMIRERV